MSQNLYIIGTGHTVFRRRDPRSFLALITEAVDEAVHESGIEPDQLGYAALGHFNDGLIDQGFTAPLLTAALPSLRFKPVVRLESACASGSAALYAAIRALQAGVTNAALVVGAEKMSERTTAEVGSLLLRGCAVEEADDIRGGFAGVFAHITRCYSEAYGSPLSAMAEIAAKNHANGALNPLAQLRTPLDSAQCGTVSDTNPEIVPPIRRTDCSPISDGATAVILATEDVAKRAPQSARLLGVAEVMDHLPLSQRDPTRFEGCAAAWRQALARAGVGLQDLDCVETHDCFTIAELMQYEAMGLAAYGEGARVLAEGTVGADGALPVNLSGGLKAKGHPVGASGVSMHALAARQLWGRATGLQAADASLAGVFNMGGVAVSNYCTILERTS